MHAIGLDECYLWDLVISDCGDLPAVMITPGNVDDRKPAPRLARRLAEKLFGDRGHISEETVSQSPSSRLGGFASDRFLSSLTSNSR